MNATIQADPPLLSMNERIIENELRKALRSRNYGPFCREYARRAVALLRAFRRSRITP